MWWGMRRQHRHTGQAGSVPKAQFAEVAPSPAGSDFSHHTCVESSAFQGLLVPLLGTGDGF